CLNHLGIATTRMGKHAEARQYLEMSLKASRSAHNAAAESHALFLLAHLAMDLGNDEEARAWAEAALVRGVASGQARQVADAHGVRGVLLMRQGDYQRAAESLEKSLDIWRQLGRWRAADIPVRLGELAIEQTQVGSAHARLTEGLLLAEELAD